MIYLDDLLETGARVCGAVRSRTFDGFAYDSRKLRPGELFVAIRTPRGDGHDYVGHACQRGAAGVLVERELDLSARGATSVVVDDARAALRLWARRVLAKHGPLVVAIAGSVGKSSAQQACVAVLGQGYAGAPLVFDNDGLGSLLGLPIALGRLEPTHQVAVCELAGQALGDTAELAALVRPTIAVVTTLEPSAGPYPATAEELAAECGDLLAALPPHGCAILNRDDPAVLALADRSLAPVFTYGCRDAAADVRATGLRDLTAEGLTFDLSHGGRCLPVRLRLLGRHAVAAALAAAAVGLVRGLALDEVVAGLEALQPLAGRLRPLPGAGGSLLLDDSLDSSPPSARAALATLAELPARRRIAVLGDLLGPAGQSEAHRRELGRLVAASVDRLVVQGEAGEAIARAAGEAGLPPERVVVTHTAGDAAASALALGLGPGDVVLVKGAEESRLEHAAQRLLAEPTAGPELLVRQDPGWRQRVFLSRERPTWVEIDLAAIGHNVRRVKEIVGPEVEVMAVLKADAYGHGAIRVARTALLHGATLLATACLSEAVALREHGITAPILMLGYTPPWQAAEIVRHDVAATVFSRDVAQQLARAAVAQRQPPTPVHVKVDTGLGRLGLFPAEVPAFVEELRRLPGLDVQGIFTHFATADSADPSYVRRQLATFRALLDELAARGITFRYVHAANSAAILTLPAAHFNLVRLGLAMHGLDPSPDVRCPPDFRRALVLKTQVAQVKSFPPGSCISYGCRFVTARPSRIAVLPVGYGDGFRRAPQHWGEVLVRGRRAPIVGAVCMDMCLVDVTDVPGVRPGDEVILIGRQGDERITVEDVAARLGTINYEVVTQILPRVPREVAPTEG